MNIDVHDPSLTHSLVRNDETEACASELLQNVKEMFPYINVLKKHSNTQYVLYSTQCVMYNTLYPLRHNCTCITKYVTTSSTTSYCVARVEIFEQINV